MRSSFLILLITTMLFGGGYFYYVAQAICPAPLAYSIGEIDESFGLSLDDVRLVLSDAENVWEDATGQNLFLYDEDSEFTVNFIYDERQARIDAEGDFKEKLDNTQNASEAINEIYTNLVSNYDELQSTYSDMVFSYEQELSSYNAQVAKYNKEGGVSEEMFEVLEDRKNKLDEKQTVLHHMSGELNIMVKKINDVGDRGNVLVETYNKGVNEYNDTFGESREFTQGTYSSAKRIDIYTYADKDELRLVLAHELGHALSLDHVSNEESIMYFLIGKQPRSFNPTQEDMDEYIRACSKKSFWSTIKESVIK